MNGQIGLSSCVSSTSVSVRDRISQITDQLLSLDVSVFRSAADAEQSSPGKTGLVCDLCRQIRDSYLGNLKSGIVATPIPEDKLTTIKPVAMSQEQIAVAVALDMAGKRRLSPEDRVRYNTELYGSIRNMVYDLSGRYSCTCPDPVDDLAQDCMYRILTQLWRFNPRRGRFTTWSYHVCRGTLNKKYRSGQRMRKHIVDGGCLVNDEGESILENIPEKPVAGVQTHECPGVMAGEIMDAVRELAHAHPKQKALIFEIFGNPDSDEFVMPSYICVLEAAKAVGMEYSRARVFYSRVVRPFMQQQLAGC